MASISNNYGTTNSKLRDHDMLSTPVEEAELRHTIERALSLALSLVAAQSTFSSGARGRRHRSFGSNHRTIAMNKISSSASPYLAPSAFVRTGVALLLAGRLMLAAAYSADDSAKADKPPTAEEQLPSLHLLSGPWIEGTVYRESLFFVKPDDGRPSAKLLFDAEKVIAVHRADAKQTFESGKDYQLKEDGSSILLPEGSRIPFRKETDLSSNIGKPNARLLFAEGHFFHDQQVEVTYVPRKDARWKGYIPKFAEKGLAGTIAKLRAKQPLTLAVSGDSISQGYNASGFTKAPPYMPPYSNLVTAQLEKSYGSKVTLHNRAIAGWSAGSGVKDIDNLLKVKPDLVIIAYGMNDVGGRNPQNYKALVAKMLDRIKEANPATEVILVASMMGNPEWTATPPEMFPRYRDALVTLERPGVVVADMTAVWEELLKRKRFVDMTGNGLNHPCDHGHRLYAQVILALLVEPALVKPSSEPTE